LVRFRKQLGDVCFRHPMILPKKSRKQEIVKTRDLDATAVEIPNLGVRRHLIRKSCGARTRYCGGSRPQPVPPREQGRGGACRGRSMTIGSPIDCLSDDPLSHEANWGPRVPAQILWKATNQPGGSSTRSSVWRCPRFFYLRNLSRHRCHDGHDHDHQRPAITSKRGGEGASLERRASSRHP
jgi:5-methylcytosine-specific restriction endonuclease McrA